MSIMKKNSNYPEPLYDVEKAGNRSRSINKKGKVSNSRNSKTRNLYSFSGNDILFSKPKQYICECGFKVKSAFKIRICDTCKKEMKIEEN